MLLQNIHRSVLSTSGDFSSGQRNFIAKIVGYDRVEIPRWKLVNTSLKVQTTMFQRKI